MQSVDLAGKNWYSVSTLGVYENKLLLGALYEGLNLLKLSDLSPIAATDMSIVDAGCTVGGHVWAMHDNAAKVFADESLVAVKYEI